MKEIFRRNVHTLGDLLDAVNFADDQVAFLSGGADDAEDIDMVNALRLIIYQRKRQVYTTDEEIKMPYKTELREKLESRGWSTLKKGFMYHGPSAHDNHGSIQIVRVRDGAERECDADAYEAVDCICDQLDLDNPHSSECLERARAVWKERALFVCEDRDSTWR